MDGFLWSSSGRGPFCGELHVVQVPETSGSGRNGEGRDARPGPAPEGQADRAFHAGRYHGDGETHRLSDRRGASSERSRSPDPPDQEDRGGGRCRSQGTAKLCPGEPEDGPDDGEVWQGQKGADRQGREKAPLLCPTNDQPGPRSPRECRKGCDEGQEKKRRRDAKDPDPPGGKSHGGEPGSGADDHADRQQDQGTSCRGQADLQHSRATRHLHHQEQGGQEA